MRKTNENFVILQFVEIQYLRHQGLATTLLINYSASLILLS